MSDGTFGAKIIGLTLFDGTFGAKNEDNLLRGLGLWVGAKYVFIIHFHIFPH